jgi:hypothetical protein
MMQNPKEETSVRGDVNTVFGRMSRGGDADCNAYDARPCVFFSE